MALIYEKGIGNCSILSIDSNMPDNCIYILSDAIAEETPVSEINLSSNFKGITQCMVPGNKRIWSAMTTSRNPFLYMA